MASRMNNLTGKEWLQLSFTIWRDLVKTIEEKANKHPASFPASLVERILRIYLSDTHKLVLDPFVGTGTTLLAAQKLGHNSVGFDLSEAYCKISAQNVENAKGLWEHVGVRSQVINTDSRRLLEFVPPSSVDIAITSPPYWNILNQARTVDKRNITGYSEMSEDLGNIDDYSAFLLSLKEVFTQVYAALKPNARCISVVMDIRKKDKFFPLHEDQTRIMKEIGFELEEYVIWDRQRDYNNMKTLGYPWVFRFNRVHEFICVYWKR